MEEKKMKINCIIAIDPGVSNGGICIYRPKDKPECKKMPKDIYGLRDILQHYKGISKPIVFVEKLNVRPDDVRTKEGEFNPKIYRIQKMLANLTQIKTVLELLDIPFVLVHPSKWQSVLKLYIKGEDKNVRKRRYREVARQLYPIVNTTLWNADAILMMHFGRCVLQNDLSWVLQNLPERTRNSLF